jgi:hypothetical protein
LGTTYKDGMRNKAATVSSITLALLIGFASAARADFVDRPLVLPRAQWALDLGLGIGHLNRNPPLTDITGLGFNLELRGGISDSLEIGLRTGIRIGNDGKFTFADSFGRTFNTETYDPGLDTVANPEVTLKFALARGDVAAVALEGGVYIPIDGDVGILLALPLHLHLAPAIRFDTGVYVPIVFTDPDTSTVVSFPFHLWFEIDRVAIGLLTGVRLFNPGTTEVPLGAGINLALNRDADLRGWLLFPNVRGSGSTNYFGGGIGIELRF